MLWKNCRNECAHNVLESRRYHSSPGCRTTLSPSIYSLRGKQLRLVRWHKGRLGWRDAWNKLCFQDALWYSFSFCLHRRPLCWPRVIGFTHDDKVERSDPAIVKSVIILNNCLWEKIPGEVFIRYYTTCHNRGTTPATGYWCQSPEQKEERLSSACHYFRFLSLKRGLGAVPFYGLPVWKIYGLFAMRLCEIVTAGMQWKDRNPTKACRRSPLLPVQTRSLLKKQKKMTPITVFLQSVCHICPIKRSRLHFNFACHVFSSHKPFVTPLRFPV